MACPARHGTSPPVVPWVTFARAGPDARVAYELQGGP